MESARSDLCGELFPWPAETQEPSGRGVAGVLGPSLCPSHRITLLYTRAGTPLGVCACICGPHSPLHEHPLLSSLHQLQNIVTGRPAGCWGCEIGAPLKRRHASCLLGPPSPLKKASGLQQPPQIHIRVTTTCLPLPSLLPPISNDLLLPSLQPQP